MKHVIIGEAFCYQPKSQNSKLNDYCYDEKKGFWINRNNSVPLVRTVDGPKPTTKKADVETGEDKKGE